MKTLFQDGLKGRAPVLPEIDFLPVLQKSDPVTTERDNR
jgi:hypothetical protein